MGFLGGGRAKGTAAPAALLLATILAGCLRAPPAEVPSGLEAAVLPPLVTAVEDPEGDARVMHPGMARGLAYQCRAAGNAAWGACAVAVGAAVGALPPHAGGQPGPAQLDVLRGSFRESAEHLEVRVEVARLDEAFVRAALEPDAPRAAWSACWTLDGVPECAYLEVQNITGIYSAYDRYTDACNPFWWCSWRIGHALEMGAPGAIVLSIPRALVGAGASGVVLEDPVLAASTEPPVHRLGPAGAFRWEVHGGAEASGQRDDTHDAYSADVSDPGAPVRLALEAAPLAPSPAPFGFDDPRDAPSDRPDADLLRLEVHETPAEATLAARLAEVRAAPGDLEVGFGWGVPAGFVVEAFVRSAGGAWAAEARACTADGCGLEVPVAVAVAQGAPGWVNLTFARADLGSPSAGDLTRVLYAWTVTGETRLARDAGAARVAVGHGGDAAEFAGVAPPHRFLRGSSPT